MFTLTIETGNLAFDGEELRQELARCLRRVAHQVDVDLEVDQARIMDINGNSVGTWSLT